MGADRVEVVVVGGGVLGEAAAGLLAARDRSVVVVERGAPASEPAGGHLRNGPLRAAGDEYFAGIDAYFEYFDPDAAPSGLPGAFVTTVAGGMSVTWTNNCPRAVAGVDRPELGESVDWDDLFAEAERLLEVHTDQFTDSARGRLVRERLDGPLADDDRQLAPLPLAGRRVDGHHIHYVGPADIADPAVDRRAGRVERLVIDGDRVRGVIVDGEPITADAVVLAAGAIETPGLLWSSGYDHPALGRYLSYHPVLIAQVVLDGDDYLAGPTDPLPRLYVPPTAQYPWHTMLLRDTNPLPVAGDDLDVDPNRLIEIQAFAPVEPRLDNRLTLNADGRWEFSVPLDAADARRRRAIEADVEALAGRLGRFRRGCTPAWAPLGTPHLMGTCRMGGDSATAVVDIEGRVRGLSNVYAASNAVIPSRLAVNPTLTATALAVHMVRSVF
ncbi:MAG: GMC oxidoreductase [Actinomycetota bacterium]